MAIAADKRKSLESNVLLNANISSAEILNP